MTGVQPAAGPAAPGLTRTALARPAAPVRIVHLGLGAFHRAHQAWYTSRSADAADWGIAAFTGRSPQAADQLRRQDGLYTVIERGDDGDRAAVVDSISVAVDGADMAVFHRFLAAPSTAVVTMTVTEPGYRLRPDGTLDLDDPRVGQDLAVLTATRSDRAGNGGADRDGAAAAPQTAVGRLVSGLAVRRRRHAGPIAIVPCDNIPANGALVRGAVQTMATEVDPGLGRWITRNVSFVSTSVDRITPRSTETDRRVAAALTGYADAVPVVTEPFTDWTVSGEFPLGRPAWESAGARFVTDIAPFEQRKLLLLNGAHSLIAYLGDMRGHRTVAEAFADQTIRGAVEDYWMEARRGMSRAVGADEYCSALVPRFGNRRIRHELRQIGMDGVSKLPVRIVPVARRERAARRSAAGCVPAVAAWAALAARGRLPADAHHAAIAAATTAPDPIAALIGLLDADLSHDAPFVAAVRRCVAQWTR